MNIDKRHTHNHVPEYTPEQKNYVGNSDEFMWCWQTTYSFKRSAGVQYKLDKSIWLFFSLILVKQLKIISLVLSKMIIKR